MMDKDFCLSMVKSTEYKKLPPLDTRKQLEATIQTRKERSEKYWLQEECNRKKRLQIKARNNVLVHQASSVTNITDKMNKTRQIAMPAGAASSSKGHEKPYSNDIAIVRLIKDREEYNNCLLYTSPSPRDRTRSRMPSSA